MFKAKKIALTIILILTTFSILSAKTCNFCTSKSAAYKPFWKTKTVHQESLFFIRQSPTELPSANLIFKPKKIISLKNAEGTIIYLPKKDYIVNKKNGKISLPETTSIPYKNKAELYPKPGSPNAIDYLKGDPNTALYWGEGGLFHSQQIEITYKHKQKWKGCKPASAKKILPVTFKKLKNKEPLTICLSGDSISQGFNASLFTNTKPFSPPYGKIVATQLEKTYGSKITYKNFAIAGWTADRGLADANNVANENPDLVIIAYGMNDIRRKDPILYKNQVAGIMNKIKQKKPDTEFILVATMLGNKQWQGIPAEQFPKYRDALKSLAAPKVAIADMTTLWQDLLKTKSFYDLTGNGVNHPNDFGHRIYAQVILTMLSDKYKTIHYRGCDCQAIVGPRKNI